MNAKRILSLMLAILMMIAAVPMEKTVYAYEVFGPDYPVENPYGTDEGDAVGLIPVSKMEQLPDDNEVITVPCKNLYTGFVNLYGVDEPTEEEIEKKEITKGQIRRIWKLSPEKCVAHNTLECGVKVSRIYGLEHATKLRYLSLPYQRVTDLGPLLNLNDLIFLNLRDNEYEGTPHTTEWNGQVYEQKPGDRITNLVPLSHLKKLEYLDIMGAKPGETINALANLTNMRSLAVNATGIDSLEFAKKMTNLFYLDSSHNPVSDLEPLKNLTNLKILKLGYGSDSQKPRDKKIENINVLANFQKLTILDISNHNISDISVLNGINTLEELYATKNPISDLSGLKKLPRLRKVVVDSADQSVSNSEKEFIEAKNLYSQLNKMVLTKTDLNVLEKLLNAGAGVKAFFNKAELDNFAAIKEQLDTKDQVYNDLFEKELPLYEVVSAEPVNVELKVGDDVSKLSETVEVEVKKIGGGDNNGKIEADPNVEGAEIVKIAVVDSKGKRVVNPIEFTVEEASIQGMTSQSFKVSSDSGFIALHMANYDENISYDIKLKDSVLFSFAHSNNKLAVIKNVKGEIINQPERFIDNLYVILPDDVAVENQEPMGEFIKEEHRDKVKIAISKSGKLVTEPIEFKIGNANLSEEQMTVRKSEAGYLTMNASAIPFNEDLIIYQGKVVFKVGSGISSRLDYVINANGKYTFLKDNSDAENKKLVIDLDADLGTVTPDNPVVPPAPNPDESEPSTVEVDESKIGFFDNGKEARFVAVDENDKVVTDELAIKVEGLEEYEEPIAFKFNEGIYSIKSNGGDYSYRLSLNDDKYEIVSSHKITCGYPNFSYIEKDGQKATVDNEIKNCFIINVKRIGTSLEPEEPVVPPAPNPDEPEPSTVEVDESKIGFFDNGKEARFVVVDENNKVVKDELAFKLKDTDGFGDPLNIVFSDGIYLVKNDFTTYVFDLSMTDEQYTLVSSHKIATGASAAFNWIEKGYSRVKPSDATVNKDCFIINVKKDAEDSGNRAFDTMFVRKNLATVDLYMLKNAYTTPVSINTSKGLDNTEKMNVSVKWDTTDFDTTKAGEFTLTGEIVTDLTIKNPNNIIVTLNATVESVDPVEYVEIEDPLFLHVINKNLSVKRDAAQKVTKAEMESLTEISIFLNDDGTPNFREEAEGTASILGIPKSLKGTDDFKFAVTRGIKSIKGIEYAVNLKKLKINENEISDLKPLENLNKLEYLELSRNRIVDLKPLENLKELTYLKLYANLIEGVEPLKDLEKLKDLDLHYNVTVRGNESNKIISKGITDISALKNLVNLRYLDISANRIEDVSVIGNMTKLKDVDISSNHIRNFVGAEDVLAKLYVAVANEEGGSLNMSGQTLLNEIKIASSDNKAEFAMPFEGLNNVINKVGEAFDADGADIVEAFFPENEVKIDGEKTDKVTVHYDFENDKIVLDLTDEFIADNADKDVKLSVAFVTEAGSYVVQNVVLHVNLKNEAVPEKIDVITVKVNKDNVPLAESSVGIYKMEKIGATEIPNVITTGKTDTQGIITFKVSDKNAKYEIGMLNKSYKFDNDKLTFVTDANGSISIVDGKPITKAEEAVLLFNAFDKTEEIHATKVKFMVLDKENNKPMENVVLSANNLYPSTGKLKDEASNEDGIVEFTLEGQEGELGKQYAICLAKNEQFKYDFEPELVTIKIVYAKELEEFGMSPFIVEIYNGKEFVELTEMPIIYVTANDRTALIDELKAEIKKAEDLINKNKFDGSKEAEQLIKELKDAILGSKKELEKDETIPYYVEEFLIQLKSLEEKLSKHIKADDKEPENDRLTDKEVNVGNGTVTTKKDLVVEIPTTVKTVKEIILENFNIPEAGTVEITFTDIENSEYKIAIETIASRGLMSGTGEGKFAPEATTKRAELYAMLYRMSKNKEHASVENFKDVPKNAWYEEAASWAKATGLSVGDDKGNFRGEANITRAEFVVVLNKFLKQYGIKMQAQPTSFKDEAEFKAWYGEMVKELYSLGLLDGETFGATEAVSRAELAYRLEKLFGYINSLK